MNENNNPIVDKAPNDDDDDDEGLILGSPNNSRNNSPNNGCRNENEDSMQRSVSPYGASHAKSRSRSDSRSRSLSKGCYDSPESRSPSKSRRYSRSHSRSRKRRRRSHSRSRSPYMGPIIKDYRRGRRGYGGRFPRFRGGRGYFRKFMYPFASRRREFNRSRSRSFSPRNRFSRSPENFDARERFMDDERAFDDKSETLKPSNIKMSQKLLTQSFLAMLEERQNKSKMVPIQLNRDDPNQNKTHGFVNTFNTLGDTDPNRGHTLSYDLEKEGWRVIDDADDEGGEGGRGDHGDGTDHRDTTSDSVDYRTKKKKKKTKRRNRKKKRKQKSTDTSDEDSDDDDDDDDDDDSDDSDEKKKSKKGKRKKKKKQKSSVASENESKKHKKKKRKKSLSLSSDDNGQSEQNESKRVDETINAPEKDAAELMGESKTDVHKKKEKKKKKRKDSSDDSDTESDSKKKKKKVKKERSKKKKRESSSSSVSSDADSSDTTDSDEKRKRRKRKKTKKKSKKSKKYKKDKKDNKHKNSDNKKKAKHNESTENENVPLNLSEESSGVLWPKSLVKYTMTVPSLQYCINPKVQYCHKDFVSFRNAQSYELSSGKIMGHFDSFRSDIEDDYQTNQPFQQSNFDDRVLASEYERFMDELNPDSMDTNHDSLILEMQLRERLINQMHKGNDNVNMKPEFELTPSEIRAMEKMKKQQHLPSSDEYNKQLDSAPLSTYYSVKRMAKSSPKRTNDTEKDISKSETDPFIKSEDISISFSERPIKIESSHITSKNEETKSTAKELLERVKQKKGEKRDDKSGKDYGRSSKLNVHIGKMRMSQKKHSKSDSITTANADSTQNVAFSSEPMKLDMNYDYNWYYQYYLNHYSMNHFSVHTDMNYASAATAAAAAYFAHYSMVTSNDYNQIDLSNWMLQNGYALDTSDAVETEKVPEINTNEIKSDVQKEDVSEVNVESTDTHNTDNCGVSAVNDNKETSDAETSKNSENVSQSQNTNDTIHKLTSDVPTTNMTEIGENFNFPNNIEVVVSDGNNTNYFQKHLEDDASAASNDDDENRFASANSSKTKNKVKVRVTTTTTLVLCSDNDSGPSPSPPPPPPPPQRPEITTLTCNNPITLPNGQTLPAGTKQIIVHPYTNAAYHYPAEAYYNTYNTMVPNNGTNVQNNGK